MVFGAGPGAMRVGAVTGVDAAGRRAPGFLRVDGAALELVLPAAFVDTAALPLVLDPLVGSDFAVTADAATDGDPSAAYDASNDLYLVAWTSATVAAREVRAQRVTSGGGLVGPLLVLASEVGTGTVASARTGSCDDTDRFLVAWTRLVPGFIPDYSIRAVAVSAASGATSGTLTIDATLSGTQFVERPSVASASAPGDQDLLVLYSHTGEVRARSVSVPAAGNPSAGPSVTVAAGSTLEPDLSPGQSSAGHHLAVWARVGAPFDADAFGRVLDDDGNPVGAEFVVAGTNTASEFPTCDANVGAGFAVAVSRTEGLFFGAPRLSLIHI